MKQPRKGRGRLLARVLACCRAVRGEALVVATVLGLYAVVAFRAPEAFHSLAILFSICVAFAVFLFALSARAFLREAYLPFLGVAYLCVAFLDATHLLVFERILDPGGPGGTEVGLQLWLASRILEAVSLLAVPLLIGRGRRSYAGEIAVLGAGLLVLIAAFLGLLPPVRSADGSQSVFAVGCEAGLVMTLAATVALLVRSRRWVARKVLLPLGSAVLLTMASEFVFMLHEPRSGDVPGFLGHMFEVLSFYLIYKAIIAGALREPYETMFRDLKTSEKALRDDKAGLQAQLAQSQKMEAIGQLAGGVAHDFNNMMTVVTGYARRMLRRTDLGEDLTRGLREIEKTGERATVLTRQLLTFSRRQPGEARVVDLNTVIRDVGTMLAEVIREDIELTLSLHGSLWQMNADPVQLGQIVLNLATNARDAMPKGGGLSISTDNVCLTDDRSQRHLGARAGEYVQLVVSDDGIGMDAETKSRAFEPFFTTKPQGRGAGLGLSTVYGIVKQLGGDIWLYSEPGKGTTLKLYFPRAAPKEEPARAEPAARKPSPVRRGAETILLVEDEDGVRDLTSLELEDARYRVLDAASPEQAMEVSRAHDGVIHLLLSDVVLPTMSGPALYRELAAKRPGLKVLCMSGYTKDFALGRRPTGDGFDFIEKPFMAESLLCKVRDVLTRE